ncbi:amidohydrolase family protein [Candidatus Sumerlaeota bacterium]|nr:amidohydrolase family protein [Candidatus Sumerlaeota bacterium]
MTQRITQYPTPVDPADRILRARRILIDSNRLIEKGAMRMHRGGLTAVGPRSEFGADPGCPETDLGDVVLIPGLVNAHAHLDYSALRGRTAPGPFDRWIVRMPALRRSLSHEDVLKGIRLGVNELARSGTTAVGDIASFDLSPLGLEASGLRYVCYYEIIHMGNPPYDDVLAATERRLAATAPGPRGRLGLSPHAPYTVALPLMRILRERFHAARGLPLAIHVAESRSELRCLTDRSGPLADWFRKGGFYPRPPDDPPLARSVLGFLRAGRRADYPPDLLVHGNYLSAADMAALVREGNPRLVVCPGTREYHGVKEPVVQRARRASMPVALGADSLASNDRLDLWAEMRRFLQTAPDWSAADVFRAATVGGARALDLEGEIGVLQPGYRADFVSIALDDETRALAPKDLLEKWILRPEPPPVRQVWVDGEPILERPLFSRPHES